MKLLFECFENNMIFVDQEDGTTYRRYSTGDWDKLFGESSEPVHNPDQKKELEESWRNEWAMRLIDNG